MAIKERLLKQLNIVRDGLNAMPPFHSRDLNTTRNALVQARDLCFQGLSEKRFAEYKDTYDGLLLAIDQLAADAPDKGEIVSLCSELLQYTITQTQKETTFKKEIFFLPYKASMWDSLESVWKAANEDNEHCIAYVMPIPYADLTPEHTVAEWHCEREIFPKNVPTLDWQTVDLEEIHPDVIYIHNPYDQYNRVTSVESRYYSSNLKSCTDKLVYIPYFVLDEISPGNESAEEHISGFILTPAVLNADEVIVQSEDMRQVYINVLVRNTDQKDRAYWEKRILGLGSPKIEKVLTSKKEDFELPEAWAKIVQGKKIILYNTSLNAMLQNSDKVCDKLRYVFNIFKNRDDVALWWRPHPLMKATIHSMKPEIEEEYCEIEKEYIKEEWGVYDNTGDLHRAITWSDAYYGDGSSVVELYQEASKPIMLEMFGKTQMASVLSMVVDGSVLYFMEAFRGVLCKFDLSNPSVDVISQLPSRYLKNRGAYGVFYKKDKKYWVLPCYAKEGLEYDEREGKYTQKFVIHNNYPWDKRGSFTQAFSHDGKILFVGNRTTEFLKYDIKAGEYVPVTKWYQIIEPYVNKMPADFLDEAVLFGRGVSKGATVLLPMMQINAVLEIDINTDEAKLHFVGKEPGGYIGIVYDGNNYWILRKNKGSLIKWNYESNNISECCCALNQLSGLSNKYPFLFLVYNEGNIYLFPYLGSSRYIVIIDVVSEEIVFCKKTTIQFFVPPTVLNDTLVYIGYDEDVLNIFCTDKYGNLKYKYPINIERISYDSWKYLKESVLIEHQDYFLNDFLNNIVCDVNHDVFSICLNKKYGESIYRNMLYEST